MQINAELRSLFVE